MITSSLTGLASSLFLNAGLVRIAQKLDPVSSLPSEQCSDAHGPASCYPSNFTPKPRK